MRDYSKVDTDEGSERIEIFLSHGKEKESMLSITKTFLAVLPQRCYPFNLYISGRSRFFDDINPAPSTCDLDGFFRLFISSMIAQKQKQEKNQ